MFNLEYERKFPDTASGFSPLPPPILLGRLTVYLLRSAPAASFQTPPTLSSSAARETLEVDPLSRHPPTPPASPRASSSGGIIAHFPEGFGNMDKVPYWPEIDQLLFPPVEETFSEFSPEEMAENDVHNAFMTLQSALYNRKMINIVQTTSRATNVKNQELKGTIADLAQQRADLMERVVELKTELTVTKKKLKEGADQLARTQAVCNTFSDSLKRSDEKISELISLATNVVAYATWRGKINEMLGEVNSPALAEQATGDGAGMSRMLS
ncbi:uncharacterized protein LOC141601555 [Silene latifolia]|uniref:uncharacterized protein LOC141601555 n=1 Tax=Silene latifolia TaxID=37657 RepID=UPI003D77C159